MLTDINLDQSIDKQTFKDSLPPLQKKLAALQQRVREAGVPVLIVFEGWGASGKGTNIARLVNPLDPRYFDVLTTRKVTEDMIRRPFLWAYWCRIPAKGQITVIDKSWHRIILPAEQEKWAHTEQEATHFYTDVKNFERQLTRDGTLIIKLFLHISQAEQARRFKALTEDEATKWRINANDRTQNKKYEKHLKYFEKMLAHTNSEENPWHIIEAEDHRFSAVKTCQTIADAIEKHLEALDNARKAPIAAQTQKPDTAPARYYPSLLRAVNPDCPIDNADYKRRLDYLQERMNYLGHRMYTKRRPAVIVFEGWDAAGKGGNIKRLVAELDPRSYAVVPIGPPTPHELGRHYLWRFMRRMPKDGHFTVFDRSWYGRVLIERVEKLTPPRVWARAYDEINEMEAHLVNHGTLLLKFWLHIDKEEQYRRFMSRINDPAKRHKITDADWKNRENWDAYEEAADEMFAKTNNPRAPWIIVESNNKKYARIKTLQTVTDALDAALR